MNKPVSNGVEITAIKLASLVAKHTKLADQYNKLLEDYLS